MALGGRGGPAAGCPWDGRRGGCGPQGTRSRGRPGSCAWAAPAAAHQYHGHRQGWHGQAAAGGEPGTLHGRRMPHPHPGGVLPAAFGSAELLLTPFGAGPELLGVLGLLRYDPASSWTDAEAAAVESLARDIGRGLEHARLYEGEEHLVAELKSLDAAKTSFLASASHDLRSPLTSIISYVEILARPPCSPGSSGHPTRSPGPCPGRALACPSHARSWRTMTGTSAWSPPRARARP